MNGFEFNVQVDKGFVAQVADVMGGRSAPMNEEQRKEAKKTVVGEFSEVKHVRGILSMGRLGFFRWQLWVVASLFLLKFLISLLSFVLLCFCPCICVWFYELVPVCARYGLCSTFTMCNFKNEKIGTELTGDYKVSLVHDQCSCSATSCLILIWGVTFSQNIKFPLRAQAEV